MKKLLFLLPLTMLCCLVACKDDEAETPEYHIHIESPTDGSAYTVGDTLHIAVEFEDHNGGEIIHAGVRISDKATGTEVYTGPANIHVESPSPYEFTDDFILNLPGNADYILEARTYDHDHHEGFESVEFRINL